MGVTLSGVGKGPDAHPLILSPLTNWAGDVSDGAAEIANSSAYPLIRVVKQGTVARSPPLGPTEHAQVAAGWFRPAPTNMGAFSAVCFFAELSMLGSSAAAPSLLNPLPLPHFWQAFHPESGEGARRF